MVQLAHHHTSYYGPIGTPPHIILWSNWHTTTHHTMVQLAHTLSHNTSYYGPIGTPPHIILWSNWPTHCPTTHPTMVQLAHTLSHNTSYYDPIGNWGLFTYHIFFLSILRLVIQSIANVIVSAHELPPRGDMEYTGHMTVR